MKLPITILILFFFASCTSHTGSKPEYVKFDNLPFNIELNEKARNSITHEFPEVIMLESEYPDYNAIVKYAIVKRSNADEVCKVIEKQITMMSYDVYSENCKIMPVNNSDQISGWIFSSIADRFPLQMIASDSTSFVIHGRLEFTGPVTDTVGVLEPAVKYITADMEHLVNNLRLD